MTLKKVMTPLWKEDPSIMTNKKSCLCGCGIEIAPNRRFVNGHNVRMGRPELKGMPTWNKGTKGLMPTPWSKINKHLLKGRTNSGSFKKGIIPWIKGKKGVTHSNSTSYTKGNVPYMTGRSHSTDSREKMSKAKKGRPAPSGAFKKGRKTWNKGMVEMFAHTDATIKQIRAARLKQIFPPKDTGIEIALQNGLKYLGIQFRKHEPITGQPDIFILPNICIFVDGRFWHADPRYYKPNDIMIGTTTAAKMWVYDRKTILALSSCGYIVLRFWEDNIKTNLERCLKEIKERIN